MVKLMLRSLTQTSVREIVQDPRVCILGSLDRAVEEEKLALEKRREWQESKGMVVDESSSNEEAPPVIQSPTTTARLHYAIPATSTRPGVAYATLTPDPAQEALLLAQGWERAPYDKIWTPTDQYHATEGTVWETPEYQAFLEQPAPKQPKPAVQTTEEPVSALVQHLQAKQAQRKKRNQKKKKTNSGKPGGATGNKPANKPRNKQSAKKQ